MTIILTQSLFRVSNATRHFLYKTNGMQRCLRHATRNHGRPRKSLAPVEEVSGHQSVGASTLIRPFAFTVAVGTVSFGSCAIWQYESLRRMVQNVKEKSRSHIDQFYGKAGGVRQHMNALWNRYSAGEKAVVCIIGLNIFVFSLWKIRSLSNFMITYFASNPLSSAPCMSMLFSNWSHYSLFHIGANMYVLWSFAPTITSLLGREQFVAFYVTAGVVSGFASYLYKLGRISLVPSLGASGAIMAVLGAVCSQFPDAQLSIAFVDQIIPHSFSAGNGMKALIALDVIGILLRWRLLDHAAHLGGMFFGIWYIKYGHRWIWNNREPFLKQWHNFRGKP